MELRVRVGVALLLVVVLFGTFVHYDAVEDEHDPYPTEEALAEQYNAHGGERTLLFGTVQSIGNDQFVIEIESDVGPFEITVRDGSVPVEPGGVVQVYGTLGPERTIDPSRVEVVNRSGGSALYKYGVSALGALLVAVLFGRFWRVDTDSWALEVREDG